MTANFTTSDGLRIDYFEAGSGDDLIIYHHGTPGAGPIGRKTQQAAEDIGVRVVELVRPGYGESSRIEGRTIADMVRIADELASHLGHDRYASMGWSGGGPHTLANVALSDRCVASMCIAGVGMYGQDDLDFLEGMGQDNHDEFGAALEGDAALRPMLDALAIEMADLTGPQVIGVMESLLPPVDQAVLTGEDGQEMADGLRWATRPSIYGWLDDDIAFTTDWGFALSEITGPVQIWQGGQDLMVPYSHGQWLAKHLPHADVHLYDEHGHLSIGEVALHEGFTWLKAHLR